MTDDGVRPLDRLAREGGVDFPNLSSARRLTMAGLEGRRPRLAELKHDSDAAVVLMGSWGRSEVTSGSDDDFMVLVDGPPRDTIEPSIEAVKTILDQAPGDQGIFGEPVSSNLLVDNIGLDRDDNRNLSRRMLFLLESVAATGDDAYSSGRARVLERYLDQSVKDFRPPRFLLNDIVRYWRTMCVDFAGKEREGPEKVGSAQREATHVSQGAVRRRAAASTGVRGAIKRRDVGLPRFPTQHAADRSDR